MSGGITTKGTGAGSVQPAKPTNHAQGHAAEKHAARYLQQQGYKIAALNWRHPRAEIDIVAWQSGPDGELAQVLLVEVKYRAATGQGSGLDYITPTKLRQMRFAAELWAATNSYRGEYSLAAIEVAGPGYEITDFLPEIGAL
jgi:Holliday junction resolvase-like predicted endonuclease